MACTTEDAERLLHPLIEQEVQDTGSSCTDCTRRHLARAYLRSINCSQAWMGGPTLNASRQALANDSSGRCFQAAYPDSMTSREFVDKLYDTAACHSRWIEFSP